MTIKHRCGYISLTSPDKSTVLVKASKITHISTLGNGGLTVIHFGEASIHVCEDAYDVIEKIDSYIEPELR